MPKPTFVMQSRIATTPEDGLKLVADMMLEPYFPDMSDPTLHRPLRRIAQHLLDNPELIRHPDVTPEVCAILQQFLLDHPLPKPRPPVIAALVNHLLLSSRTLATARHLVARAMAKPYAAVKKSHERYGGTK